jgi:hypothetical protein
MLSCTLAFALGLGDAIAVVFELPLAFVFEFSAVLQPTQETVKANNSTKLRDCLIELPPGEKESTTTKGLDTTMVHL